MDIEAQPFDLRECVESALDLVAARAAEKGLDLGLPVRGRGAGRPSTGDVTRLRQILLNLLSQRGQVHRARRGRADGAPRRAAADVSCTSPCATPASASRADGMGRLFQSFRQADSQHHAQVRRHRPGPGDQQAAGRADGRPMWVESAGPGHGLDLPLHDRARRRPSCPPARGATSSACSRRCRASASWSSTTTPPTAASSRCRSAKWGMRVARHRVARREALATGSRRRARSTWPSSTCTCPSMDGMRAGASASAPPGTTLPLVLFSSLGRREAGDDSALRRVRSPSRLHQIAAVRHAGDAARRTTRAPKAAHAAAKPKIDAAHRRAPPAAHPARRGQRREPEARAAPAAADGLPRRPGVERHRGGRVGRAPALRRGADGRADARDGRARGDAADHARAGPTASGRASSR